MQLYQLVKVIMLAQRLARNHSFQGRARLRPRSRGTKSDLGFLMGIDGNGTVLIKEPYGDVVELSGLNVPTISRRSAALALAFKHDTLLGEQNDGKEGGPVCHFHGFPAVAIVALFRWAYTGSYQADPDPDDISSKPPTLLLHLQLLRLAIFWELNDLQGQAGLNILMELELSCCTGQPANDLCESIRYLMTELRQSHNIRETIAQYAVTYFAYHHLGNSESFRQTVFECPAFHRDMLIANLRSNFSTDHAMDIINLPVCHHYSHQMPLGAQDGTADFTCHFHSVNMDYGLVAGCSVDGGEGQHDGSSTPTHSSPQPSPTYTMVTASPASSAGSSWDEVGTEEDWSDIELPPAARPGVGMHSRQMRIDDTSSKADEEGSRQERESLPLRFKKWRVAKDPSQDHRLPPYSECSALIQSMPRAPTHSPQEQHDLRQQHWLDCKNYQQTEGEEEDEEEEGYISDSTWSEVTSVRSPV